VYSTVVEARSDILIIDDKPANLHLLSSILKERGHEVRAVVNGSMGLIAAKTIKPDLILLDVRMPGMDGYEVCRHLKADDHLSQIPVIFISSLEDTLDKVKAFQSGGVDYITKPFQVEEVIARVEAQLALYHVYQQAQQLAALKERQRLARELHDAVSQTLFSTSVMAETLLYQYRQKPDQIESGLRQIYDLSQAALAEMRVLFFELRPETLIAAPLGALLTQLANSMKARTKAEISLQVEDQAALPPEVHLSFYRVAQEALNNIVKHARASQIHLELRDHEGHATLTIADNGRGFIPESVPPGHFGLINMQERADEVGAELHIQSDLERGTIILFSWRHEGS
jgi:signal transduction histidine kinase